MKGMEFDKEKIKKVLGDGAKTVKKAAKDTKDAVVTKYNETKLLGQLDDLYIELGVLVNGAYNSPGTVDEQSVANLNEKINAKREELANLKNGK